jgi:hypothetical protein
VPLHSAPSQQGTKTRCRAAVRKATNNCAELDSKTQGNSINNAIPKQELSEQLGSQSLATITKAGQCTAPQRHKRALGILHRGNTPNPNMPNSGHVNHRQCRQPEMHMHTSGHSSITPKASRRPEMRFRFRDHSPYLNSICHTHRAQEVEEKSIGQAHATGHNSHALQNKHRWPAMCAHTTGHSKQV